MVTLNLANICFFPFVINDAKKTSMLGGTVLKNQSSANAVSQIYITYLIPPKYSSLTNDNNFTLD